MFCFGLVFPITLVSYSCYTLSDLSAISEVARRMLHTSRRLEDSSWMESLEDLTQRMVNSDHRPAYIRKVMVEKEEKKTGRRKTTEYSV